MNIISIARNFDGSVELDAFVREQLNDTFERLDADIVAVDVFMEDVNGPKGGVDKHALFRVKLRNRQVVTIESKSENWFAAIKNGVKRTKRAVHRQLRKARQIEKQRITDLTEFAA